VRLHLDTRTNRPGGGVTSRSAEASAETVRLGRGTDNEVQLADPRVPLRAATIHQIPEGIRIEAAGSQTLLVNGALTRIAMLTPGDRVDIGPFQLGVAAATEGFDLSLTIERQEQAGDAEQALRDRSRLTLAECLISKRKLAWVFATIIAVLFIALPLSEQLIGGSDNRAYRKVEARSGGQGYDIVWRSGEMMNEHKYFANDCVACHEKPFQVVADQACTNCHAAVTQHADKKHFSGPNVAGKTCTSCHKEHQGSAPQLVKRQALCVSCHADLKDDAPSTTLLNVSSFVGDHPEFRPTVSVAPESHGWKRISLDQTPRETSNLKFSHKAHADAKKMKWPDGRNEAVKCGFCHQPQVDGGRMIKVEQESKCGVCHRLSFEKTDPKRTVTHGKPDLVARELREYYANRALEGGVEEEAAPLVVRRRPGTAINDAERLEALGWARKKAEDAIAYMFSKSQCGTCHTVTETADGAPTVKPVQLTADWQPKSWFSHRKHEQSKCGSCHATEASESSADVLLPLIATCRKCHADETSQNKVPSPCGSCHLFHQPDLEPVKATKSASKQ